MNGTFKVVGVLDDWKKGDLPGNQMINIILNHYGTLEGGNIALTPQLASDDEVDEAIDYLIRELEIARNRAKENIAKTNKRIRATI